MAGRVRNAAVPIGGETVEEEEGGPERPGSAETVPERRNHDGEGMHQVRGDPQQRGALPTGFANPGEVQVLEVADAAVDDLERVRRGLPSEISALEQGNRQAALRCIAGGRRAADPTTHHKEIELAFSEVLELALHRTSRIPRP